MTLELLNAFLPSHDAIDHFIVFDCSVMLTAFEFLIEATQGPCPINQEILVYLQLLLYIL